VTLEYTKPPGCIKLKRGARVAVCDRFGKVVSIAVIKKSGHTKMTLDDGR